MGRHRPVNGPHVIAHVLTHQEWVFGKHLGRQVFDIAAHKARIFLRRRRAVDFQNKPFFRLGLGHDQLLFGGQEMVKAQALEPQVGFQQQQQRSVRPKLAVMQHKGLFEMQPVARRSAKDRHVDQRRFQRGHQHVFLFRQPVGKDQRQPVPSRRALEVRGMFLNIPRDGFDRQGF